jgi:CheY-like chemotaxis protein
MLTGDPDLVRKLVSHIERFLEDSIEDSVLEVLAIEVAGKIGHPFLRRKLEGFLTHENEAVVRAAKRALARPVNKAMLENMVRTVFALDDSAYMTRTVTSILAANGYEPRGENDTEAAIAHLAGKRYDLLILDLNMPTMRGVDFLRKIRESDISPRFVFILTSVRTHDDLIEVFKEGVDGIILKPFRTQDLLEKIAELKEKCS